MSVSQGGVGPVSLEEAKHFTFRARDGDEDVYIVRGGLKENEIVVTHGAFKIDSALQIQAKSSLMNPQGGGPVPGHGSGHEGSGHEGHDRSKHEKRAAPEER